MTPRVTVIVPLYNVEAYVGECIRSLAGQTLGDFEAICVDDGSTDATLDEARAAADGDARFLFLGQGHAGQSAARNRALAQARGEYLLNLDSDDFYSPETLERLVAKADAEDLDVLYFAARTFYETRELGRTNPERQDDRRDIPGVMSGQDLYVEFERTGSFRPSACLFMMRRQLVEDAGLRFEEGIIHEDLLFTMMVAPLARRAAFLNEALYQRRMRAGSTMTTRRGVRNIRGHLVASMRMEEWLAANRDGLSDAFCDAFCHRIYATWDLVASDVAEAGAAEVSAFRDTLAKDERIALDLHGIEPAAYREKLLGSTTYRVGRAIMALPTALKDRFSNRG